VPELGFGLNPRIVGELLRGTLGYDGVVVSDWQLVTDRVISGKSSPARGWGAEAMTPLERLAAIVDAGVDQLGGEQLTAELVGLVTSGRIRESRIDQSATRILRVKFALGLFDDPFVDEDAAATVVGHPESRAAGRAAQSRSITLLHDDAGLLPLADTLAVYVEGVDPAELPSGWRAVADPAEADLAVVRLAAPWDHRENLSMEHVFHAGSLDFAPGLVWRLGQLAATVPLVVDVRLERPAILAPVAAVAGALVANYGASPAALFDALRGIVPPEGRLPFELPRSMQAVRESREDVPGDTVDPLYPFGHGLELPTNSPRAHATGG
jgi:beta-glucosidase